MASSRRARARTSLFQFHRKSPGPPARWAGAQAGANMQCKALKTFHSTQYGYIRAGTRFASEPNYAHDLVRNGLIQILDPGGPSRTQALGGAPSIKNAPPVLQPDQDLQPAPPQVTE